MVTIERIRALETDVAQLRQAVAGLAEREGRILNILEEVVRTQGQLIERFDRLEQKMDRMKEEILEAFQRGFTTNY